MNSYSCAACHRQVDEDEAFLRSVTFRTVAWCSPCWRERHADQLIPAQRRAPAEESVPSAPRLRLLRRPQTR